MLLAARPVSRLGPIRRPILQPRHATRHFSFRAVVAECSEPAEWIALAPVSLIETIHSTGLPWYAVIPISAVMIRSAITYPLFQRSLRQGLVHRAQLQPLADANMSLFKRHQQRKTRFPALDRLETINEAWRIRAQLRRSVNPGFHFNIGHRFMMFFTTLLVSDALRRIMGAKEGLLKFVLGPLDWTVAWMLPAELSDSQPDQLSNNSPNQAMTDVSNMTAQDFMWPAATAPETPPPTVSPSATLHDAAVDQAAPAAADHVASVWFDPTLMTEGFSWCSDLTAADPTLVLPILFSSTFFASIYFAPRIAGATSTGEPPKPTNMQRIAMTVATLSIIPALQMPAGLLLYFIANTATNNIHSRWLAYTRPIHPAPTACKRPVRMKRSKEMADDLLPNKEKASTR